MSGVYAGAWDAYTALAAVNTALWFLSLLLGKTWPVRGISGGLFVLRLTQHWWRCVQVDFIWSSWPPAHAAWLVATSTEHATTTTERNTALLAIVALWGIRLTGNFVRRGGIGHVRCNCVCTCARLNASLRCRRIGDIPSSVSISGGTSGGCHGSPCSWHSQRSCSLGAFHCTQCVLRCPASFAAILTRALAPLGRGIRRMSKMLHLLVQIESL